MHMDRAVDFRMAHLPERWCLRILTRALCTLLIVQALPTSLTITTKFTSLIPLDAAIYPAYGRMVAGV